jgi:hypothetical protein
MTELLDVVNEPDFSGGHTRPGMALFSTTCQGSVRPQPEQQVRSSVL